MTFAAPTILAGLAAVAIPVLVHFLLRPRARRIRFPAVAHVRAAVAAGRRAQRLRNLVVMLLRCALVALAVFLLAGPRWSAEKGSADDGAQSTDAVIIVDDSWSTRYSPSVGRPWRDEILAAAIRELRRLEERPETRAGLLFSGQPAEAVELTTKFSSLRARLEGYESSTNARSLRTALDIAGTALARSNAMRREVVIVTDGAAHAWRDADGGSLRDLTKLHVR
ncbi:MAG: VWA domain-containing protein, partial [Planctomycetota bacterium]